MSKIDVVGCRPVATTTTTRESAVFSVDTVMIIAGGLGFAFALLGWLAGHRISLAMPPEVATRAMVPLLVGIAGLFVGAGVGLLLGELRTVAETTTQTVATADDAAAAGVAVRRVAEVLRTVTPARIVLGVGVVLLLATVWLVKPPDSVQRVESRVTNGNTAPATVTAPASTTARPSVTPSR